MCHTIDGHHIVSIHRDYRKQFANVLNLSSWKCSLCLVMPVPIT